MNLLVIPLRAEGKVLVPVSSGSVVTSDYLHTTRAIVDTCERKGWEVSRRSQELVRRVAGEIVPLAVLETGGGVPMGVWREVAP